MTLLFPSPKRHQSRITAQDTTSKHLGVNQAKALQNERVISRKATWLGEGPPKQRGLLLGKIAVLL